MRVLRQTSYMRIIRFALLTFTCILHKYQVLFCRYVVVFQIVVSTMVQTQYNHLQHTWRCCLWNGSCIDFPFLVFLNLQHGAISVHRSLGSFKSWLVALQGQNDVTLVFKNRTLHWFLSWARENAYALMVEVVMKFAVWILRTCCDAKSHHALGNIWQPCKRRGANCAGCTTTQRLPPSHFQPGCCPCRHGIHIPAAMCDWSCCKTLGNEQCSLSNQSGCQRMLTGHNGIV